MEDNCRELIKGYHNVLNEPFGEKVASLSLDEKDVSKALANDAYTYLRDKEQVLNLSQPYDQNLAQKHMAGKDPLEHEFGAIPSNRLKDVLASVNEELKELSAGRYKVAEKDGTIWLGARSELGQRFEPMMLVKSNEAYERCMRGFDKK